MRKLWLLCFVISLSGSALANSINPQMNIKERLRLSMWYEGIEAKTKTPIKKSIYPVYSEEIERPLRKL